jgi:alanine dehydrogenase
MHIAVPREIKPQEGRVALLPPQVASLCASGHSVILETGAGLNAEASDQTYRDAGAEIASNADSVFNAGELIVKVKEFLPQEYGLLRREHTVLTNLHSAANPGQLDRLLELGLVAIAAEDTHQFGSPNCALAGEVGAFEGVRMVLACHGGTGRHFMGHFGAAPATALVMGLGSVGRAALRTLLGLGMRVIGLDISAGARKEMTLHWHDRAFQADPIETLPRHLPDADLVINCVLWDKRRRDHLLSRAMLGSMKPRAAIVDISCDPAGAIETCRATSWRDPIYQVDGIRHFCVDNIPGAVPITASAGYAEALLPKVALIAEFGAVEACRRDPWLARGLTTVAGTLTLEEAARVQNRPYTPVNEVLAAL